jgi:predicted RNA-binding Zn-ribbon protein involved in translation (DUF1610 family)
MFQPRRMPTRPPAAVTAPRVLGGSTGANMNAAILDSPETLCPRCGAAATGSFTDNEKQTVEIVCPDCGRFEIPAAEFEQAEFDIAPLEERLE